MSRWSRGGAVLLGGAVACSEFLGLSEVRRAEPVDAGPDCAAFVAQSAVCAECTQASCCEEVAACEREPACSARFACLARCTPTADAGFFDEEACRAQCSIIHHKQSAADADLTHCQAVHCAGPEACSLRCGGVLGSHFPQFFWSDACTTCLDAGCTAIRACAESAACMSALDCGAACPQYSQACRAACYAPFEGDATTCSAYQRARTDVITGCKESCRESPWTCSEPVLARPRSPDEPLTISLGVFAFSTTSGVPGVTVQACAGADAECRVPLGAPTTTDARGYTMLDLGSTSTFIGFFELRPPTTEYVPLLAVIQPGITQAAGLAGPDETFCPPANVTAYLLQGSLLPGLVDLADPTGTHPLVAGLGLAAVELFDCLDHPAIGATYEIVGVTGGATTAHETYFEGSLPDPELEATPVSTSLWAAYNVPAGFQRVRARVAGRLVAEASVPVRADTLTYVRLVPDPDLLRASEQP